MILESLRYGLCAQNVFMPKICALAKDAEEAARIGRQIDCLVSAVAVQYLENCYSRQDALLVAASIRESYSSKWEEIGKALDSAPERPAPSDR